MKSARQLNKELFEYALNTNSQFKPQIGQIADEKSTIETIQQQKWTQEGTGILLRRYKVRIFSMHDDNTPVEDLPWAYGQTPTSGLRGESSGSSIYPANTFVTVFQDPDTGIYYIDDVHPNTVADIPQEKETGSVLASGFVPGSAFFEVPQTHYKDGRLVVGGELPNTPRPSEEDEKQSRDGEEPIVLPSKCRKVNTEAINSELTKLIKDIQKLKTGLTGKDSFLQTSQNFLNSAQAKISEMSSKIANWISWLIQEIRRYIMRKINGIVGNLTGAAPLSSRYLINETTKNTLSIISCLFVKLLQNLENIIAQILNAIVDKVINTASCLIENILGNLIGQIVSQLTAAINGVLGTLSSLLGSVISFTNEILDFVISILDFLSCKVENVCPVTEKWNILEGGQSSKFSLDFTSIFNSAKGIVDSAVGVINVPENLSNFNFTINPNFDIGGDCFTGPESCGPPNVVFWGGSGSGATGNAVLNAFGNIIGVDIVTPGIYSSPPTITFEDNCGNGVGAYGIPILGELPPDTGEPGDGGLPTGTGGLPTGTGGLPTGTGGVAAGVGGGPGPVSLGGPRGVVGVIMRETGYNYLPRPNGSKGGMGRTWADRCQTIVRRANGNWDPPYSYEEPIKLFFGDMIQLPGKKEVYIDCDFNPNKLPGCVVTGTLTCLKSMIGFDDNRGIAKGLPGIKSMIGFDDSPGAGPNLRSMVGFDDSPGSDQGAPNQFGYLNDYPAAKRLGYTDAEIRYYLENDYTGNIGPRMREKLNDSDWGKIVGKPNQFGYLNDYPSAKAQGFNDVDIRFYLENDYKGNIGPRMREKLNDPNWGRLNFIRSMTGFDDSPGSDQGAPNQFGYLNDYPAARAQGFSDADIRFYLENEYAGNIGPKMREKLNDPNWGRLNGFNYISSMVGFDDFRGSSRENTPPIPSEHQKRIDELVKTTEAREAFQRERTLIQQGRIPGAFRPDQFGFVNDYPYAKELGYTDQDIRFYLEGFYSKILGKRIGPLMQIVLNDPNFGPLPKYITGNGTPGVFDYENDYPYAVSLGFTDQDIRFYLETFYTGIIAEDMQRKLNDPNWGRIREFYVTITAPDCPPEILPTDNNYNVTVQIDDVTIEDGGFGFLPGDTATVLDCAGNPDASTEIELTINQDGTIVGVRVIKLGSNYTCIPEIRLNTNTGYNAKLKPILKFTRVSNDVGFEVPSGTQVLNVVDCVGKV